MSDSETTKPLFTCYIPGLDLRHVNAENTPYLAHLLDIYPSAKLKGYTCSELLPAILTGTYPRDHGKYQISIEHSLDNINGASVIDKLPDLVTTTAQSLISLLDRRFDLPGIPPRRRRKLNLKTRFKFYARSRDPAVLMDIGGLETIFSVTGVGEKKGSYRFTMEFKKLEAMLTKICQGRYSLEFLEIHSLDIVQLWYSDQPEKIRGFYRHMDEFLKKLHAQCENNGTRLVILSDRALEAIKSSIDVKSIISALPVKESDLSYFLEPPMARFWFRNEKTRQLVIDALGESLKGTLITYEDMAAHNLELDDDRFGELFFVANAGVIIFPHDFYNPIGNIYLGLTDWKQRPRLNSPLQRAVHGYLPNSEGETGIVLACDDTIETAVSHASIADVAPSLLTMLNARVPNQMKGQNIFTMKRQRKLE